MLRLTHSRPRWLQQFSVVVCEELLEKIDVAVIHDQQLVPADGAGVGRRHNAVANTGSQRFVEENE